MFLILGASGYVGKRLFEKLGPAEAIGTRNANHAAETLYVGQPLGESA